MWLYNSHCGNRVRQKFPTFCLDNHHDETSHIYIFFCRIFLLIIYLIHCIQNTEGKKNNAIFVPTCVLTCGLILCAITQATNSNRTALSSESLIIGRADFNKKGTKFSFFCTIQRLSDLPIQVLQAMLCFISEAISSGTYAPFFVENYVFLNKKPMDD